jgi:high affinity Mn2+ porin
MMRSLRTFAGTGWLRICIAAAILLLPVALYGDDVTANENVASIERASASAMPAWRDRFDLSFGVTGVAQSSSARGGSESAATESTDVELSFKATQGGTLYAHVESGSGEGLDGRIATLSGWNCDADDAPAPRLTEIWYEQAFCDVVRLRLGRIDLTSDFDTNAVANSETDQFLSSGFVNNLCAEFPEDNSFGAMLWASPCKLMDVGAGVANAGGVWDGAFDAPFAILEVDFKPSPFGLQGNYRFFGWYNGSDHDDLADGTTGGSNRGLGVSFDQKLDDVVTAFFRCGWQRDELAEVASAWSAGLGMACSALGRNDDTLGVAYGVAAPGETWRKLAVAGGASVADEGHIEIFYNCAVCEHLTISPDIQFVTNADGDRASDEVWVFSLRAQIAY